MTKVNSSPERHTFQDTKPELAEWWQKVRQEEAEQIHDPEWQRNNLEYDLRSTDWIVAKAKANESYAQNIYAALCNMQWCNIKGQDPTVTLEILKEEFWSCSWRHAGGIVADILEKGDYIDWYCSGIRNDGYQNDLDTKYPNGYVSEGVVTEEIRGDFATLGWVPKPWPEDEK